MSGEAGGAIVGVGLLVLGGPFLISAALVAAIVGATAVGAVGVGTLALQGGKTLSSRKRGSIGDSGGLEKEDVNYGRMEYSLLFAQSEKLLDEKITKLYSERNEEYKKIQETFNNERNLEKFIDYVNSNNAALEYKIQNIRDVLIAEYDMRFEIIKRDYDNNFKMITNKISSEIEKIELEREGIFKKSLEYAKAYYAHVDEIITSLEKDYPVDTLFSENYKIIKEEIESLGARISGEKSNYEDIIIALEALPIRVLEYKAKCEKELLSRGLYFNACIDKLDEINNMLNSDIITNSRFDLADIFEDMEENQTMDFDITDYMVQSSDNLDFNSYNYLKNYLEECSEKNNKYDKSEFDSYKFIKEQLEKDRKELENGYELLAENELVEKYREIVELHTYVVNEMFGAAERFRNACMRDEMNDSMVQELQNMGYIIQTENDIETKSFFSSIKLVNPETSDTITLRIEEDYGRDSRLNKEIGNRVSINHDSKESDLIGLEEHRKELREKIKNSWNQNRTLQKNKYKTRNLSCNMETYKQNCTTGDKK